MRARPILFSAPMVDALLDGRKTQTRRVAKLTDSGRLKAPGSSRNWHPHDREAVRACPYGAPGDLLWVRETWSEVGAGLDPQIPVYRATYPACVPRDCENVPDDIREAGYRWKPSIHMPRRLSRLTLRVTAVRVERLQDISVNDAQAEGVDLAAWEWGEVAVGHFATLWDSINGPGSWDANPWVWAVSFEVLHENVEAVLLRSPA